MTGAESRATPSGSALASVLALAVPGTLLAAGATADIYPLAALARALAPDGAIDPSFRQLLEHAQQTMGLCLLVASPLGGLPSGFLRAAADRIAALGDRVFATATFFLAFSLALVVQWSLLDAQPHVTDETCHWFQAQLLAMGRMYAPLPPCPDAFFQFHMVMLDTGRWFSKYPPGASLALVPGFTAGLPWLMPPLWLGCTAFVVARLGNLLLGASRGRATALLFATSPLALLLGASYMSHIPALLLLLLGALLLVRAAEEFPHWSTQRAWLAGLCFGGSLLVRPQDVVIAAGLGVVSLVVMANDHRAHVLRLIPWLLPGVVLGGMGLLAWNVQLFGSFDLGYASSNPHLLTPVFKDQVGFGGAFGPAQALHTSAVTCFRFNSAMTGWPLGLLLTPLALWRPERPRIAWFCAAGVLAIIGAYALYNYLGAEYEARYYTLALPMALALLVLAFDVVRAAATRWLGSAATGWVTGLVAAFTLYTAGHYWPAYVAPKYGDGYEAARPQVARAVRDEGLENALVLVPTEGSTKFSYSSVFHLNDPLLRGNVYARDPGGDAKCLRAAFPDRPQFRFIPACDWNSGRLVRIAPAAP